jgi:hypothetical protein
MKLKDFIEALQEYDPELIVTLADWNECYEKDSEQSAEDISIKEWAYRDKANNKVEGKHLVIGWEDA